ncbi:uncharacterized protein EV420DRAFT_1525773 [Desarmillaria tabescens]|uniref:Protein kinase domain-containing protein n=1 Tax=Armillaria tabescens TaxID=1929756 RepID=A0AA39NBI4_ARMTA|nr:uncharacterized protein EV420DRAFT_1525773 [Desarmillaria tabescens]KAK0462595.1 hypothetical protein EV420DRAFT_1525773 [Desarmillaria tabescens]
MDFPRTLVEWRNNVVVTDDEVPYYDMWKLPFLIQFFHDHGLDFKLWIPVNDCELSPPNNNPRLHDYTYLSDYPGPPTRFYGLERAIHCPARTCWNQDVILRLISIDGDISGVEHHLALKRLSTGEDSFRGRNHALPVLQELKYEGLTFVVFPMMWSAHRLWWFYDLGEILDFVLQVTEGLNFCHERLVAHLDISYDNILVNFAGGAQFPKDFRCWEQVAPLRSHFPVRYYINDFEHAAVFSEDSEPSDRVISGLPNARWGGTKEKFLRRVPPEMEKTEPYCPFRADVWSLGGLFQRYLGVHLLQFSKKV